MKFLKIALQILFVSVGMLSVTSSLPAQSTTGSVYGVVSDPTGASIPGATVTVKDVHTGIAQSTTTNGSGEYTFTTLNPGDYVVTSTAKGFKTQAQTGVAVASNQNVHVTFALTAGEVSETVEVEAAVTLVDTRESQLAETIEQVRFQSLPTLNRSTYDLVQTIPGVTNYAPDVQTGSRNGANFSVNGLPSDMVSYYLDGAYNNSYKAGGGNKVPNPDALQEFRLITSNFDAEFGRSPGAVANVITRSGTSHYHGSAYEYLRNDILNARNYFVAPGPRLPYKQNQFGGTFGGPVMKDKLFFFLAYEQLVLHQTSIITRGALILPTDLERVGDFSASALPRPVLPAPLAGAPTIQCGTVAAPKVCAAALDPVAQNLLKFVPHNGSDGVSPQQSAPNNISSYQGLGRIDFNGFSGHSIEAMYFNTPGTEIAPSAGGNQLFGYSGMTNTENQSNIVLADNWTVNARAVNSTRLFYSQNKYVIGNLYDGHFLADVGSTGGEGGPIFAPPKFNVNGFFSAGPAGAGPSNISQLSYGGIDTLTLTRGHHSIKVGGSYVWNKYMEDGGNTAGGTFGFASNSSVTGGTALSDFIIGRANQLVQSSSVHHRTHQYDPALYAQDDWQITPRLNLNLGMRWEVFPPHCCEPQITGTFVAGQQSTVVPKAPIGLVYQGDKGVAPGLFSTSMLDFAPRIGFAYDAYGNGRSSIRGGFGMFYQTVEQFNFGTMNQLPFSLSTTTAKPPNLVTPYGVGGSPYPFVFTPAAPKFADNSTTQVVRPGTTAPYVYEYNLTFEQQLNSAFAFRLGYVGNATRKNMINLDTNAPVYFAVGTTGLTAAQLTGAAGINCRRPYEPYRTTSVAPVINCAYAGFSGNSGADVTLGKTYGGFNDRQPALNANYNSLQASVRGRIGTKFNLLASYVWAKALDYAGPTVDNTDLHKNKGVSDVDIRNRFNLSFLYHLPEAKLWGQFGKQVLSGWQLNDVTTLQSGSPFTVTSGTDTNLDGSNNDRVNIVGDPYTHAKTRQDKIARFINPNAFAQPADILATDNPYGNEQRNQLVGPGNIVTNLSLFKEFAIYHEARFQFRAESFNVFGNVNLANPRTNLSVFKSLTQGQITAAGDPRRMQFAAKILF